MIDFSHILTALKEKLNPDQIKDILEKIPVVDVIVLFKEAFDALPQEKKIEVAQNLLLAASKAAAAYAAH